MNITDYTNVTEATQELNARYSHSLLLFTVTLGCFIGLGLVGNLLTIAVFSLSREFDKNNFKVFAITLAVIDTFTCITLLPVEIITHRMYFMFQDVILCKVKCFLTVFGASSSCLSLLVISVDRFRKVVRPLRKQLTPGDSLKILIVVAFVVPILLAIPGSLMCGINKTNMRNVNGELIRIYFCETEDKYRYSVWRPIYKYTLLLLQLGISLVYIILYTFVMKEASQQASAIKELKKHTSALDVTSGHTGSQDRGSTTSLEAPTTNKSEQEVLGASVENSVTRKQIKKIKLKHLKEQKPIRQISNISLMTFYKNGFPAKTMVWFVLTLIFVVTYMVHLGLTLKVSDIVHMSASQFAWFVTFFRIYFVNHVINPIIYAIFIKRYRLALLVFLGRLKQIICCHKTSTRFSAS